MFGTMGYRRDVKIDQIVGVAEEMANFFGRDLPGTVYRTGTLEETRT
jgi:hypothetical protein